jgi:hypothetical protein
MIRHLRVELHLLKSVPNEEEFKQSLGMQAGLDVIHPFEIFQSLFD